MIFNHSTVNLLTCLQIERIDIIYLYISYILLFVGAEADELLLSVQINEAITQFFNNAYPKFEVSDTLTTELFVSKLVTHSML